MCECVCLCVWCVCGSVCVDDFCDIISGFFSNGRCEAALVKEIKYIKIFKNIKYNIIHKNI